MANSPTSELKKFAESTVPISNISVADYALERLNDRLNLLAVEVGREADRDRAGAFHVEKLSYGVLTGFSESVLIINELGIQIELIRKLNKVQGIVDKLRYQIVLILNYVDEQSFEVLSNHIECGSFRVEVLSDILLLRQQSIEPFTSDEYSKRFQMCKQEIEKCIADILEIRRI